MKKTKIILGLLTALLIIPNTVFGALSYQRFNSGEDISSPITLRVSFDDLLADVSTASASTTHWTVAIVRAGSAEPGNNWFAHFGEDTAIDQFGSFLVSTPSASGDDRFCYPISQKEIIQSYNLPTTASLSPSQFFAVLFIPLEQGCTNTQSPTALEGNENPGSGEEIFTITRVLPYDVGYMLYAEDSLDEASGTLGDSLLVLWTFIVSWGVPILLTITVIALAFSWFRRR